MEFEEWLKELNIYANKVGWFILFEDDEFSRELFEDGEKPHNAFQELARE